jgi:hypothetical protein
MGLIRNRQLIEETPNMRMCLNLAVLEYRDIFLVILCNKLMHNLKLDIKIKIIEKPLCLKTQVKFPEDLILVKICTV